MIFVESGPAHARLRPEDVRMEHVRLDREPARTTPQDRVQPCEERTQVADVVQQVDAVREVGRDCGLLLGEVDELIADVQA